MNDPSSTAEPDPDNPASPQVSLHPIRPLLPVILAFAAVYLTWSSTYLAMLWATETIPVFLMAGVRFLIAGGLMYLLVRLRGDHAPTWRQMRTIVIGGFLLMVIGNAGVVWAEAHHLPTGIASLLVALTPMATALLDWLVFRAERPRGIVLIGLLLGVFGMAVLLAPSLMSLAEQGTTDIPMLAVLAVIVAVFAWSLGALQARYTKNPASIWVTSAMQMIVGGMQLVIVSMGVGEFDQLQVGAITTRSLLSVVYLIVFGSWIGYSAFAWLMTHVNPTMVATYGFVNPVLAVMIGSIVLGESLRTEAMIGGGIILGSVMLIIFSHARRGSKAAFANRTAKLATRTSRVPILTPVVSREGR